MAKHALLSPSASDRWLHCTPSARMEAAFPPEENSAALEGTLCHELAELTLKKELTDARLQSLLFQMTSERFDTEELRQMAAMYVDAVRAVAGDSPLHVEAPVNLSAVMLDCWGTVDCWFVKGDTLYVFDAKFGRVPVEAVANSQLMIYALGAYFQSSETAVDTVSMNIVQPRAGGLKSWVVSRDFLIGKLPELTQKARAAYYGEGHPVSGRWCTYCRAKGLCPVYASKLREKAATLKRSSAAGYLRKGFYGLSRALELSGPMKKYIDAAESFARKHLENGGSLTGWHLEPGARRTAVDDPSGLIQYCGVKGYAPEKTTDLVPRPLSELKKVLDPVDYQEAVERYCTVKQNKPSLKQDK